MQTPVAQTLVRLAIEYLLTTLPIVIYVTIEAIHKESIAFLWKSPEWSIATIFLALQTVRMFVECMDQLHGRHLAVLLLIVQGTLITAASLNAYMGIHVDHFEQQSLALLIMRGLLLVLATLMFFCFAGSAIWSEAREADAPESRR